MATHDTASHEEKSTKTNTTPQHLSQGEFNLITRIDNQGDEIKHRLAAAVTGKENFDPEATHQFQRQLRSHIQEQQQTSNTLDLPEIALALFTELGVITKTCEEKMSNNSPASTGGDAGSERQDSPTSDSSTSDPAGEDIDAESTLSDPMFR
jgi:hypothetical protein